MSHAPPRERLNRLVELAAEDGLAARRALTSELADLLLDWPSAYPESMREPFEALLEKAIADIEPEARALLATRFAERPTTPIGVLNALIFDATPEIRAYIFTRNIAAHAQSPEEVFADGKEAALLAAIRQAQLTEITRVLASHLGIPLPTAQRIVEHRPAEMLAALCKGTELSRAAFSAIAVLTAPLADVDELYRRLAIYDDVPEEGARGLVTFWRRQAALQLGSPACN